jgi:MFS family permease
VELATLFFLNAAAVGMWSVPFGNVLKAYGYERIIAYAYACCGISAFISPMIVGALADQHISATKLVRWLAALAAVFLALTFYGIGQHWRSLWVLTALLVYAVFAAPVTGLSTTIVMARLHEPARQFGPIRAWATLGWMASGWLVSWGLHADTATLSGFAAAATLLLSAACTYALPDVIPEEPKTGRNWRDIFGLEALGLLANRDHRAVFVTAALFNIPMAAFYPYTPMQLRDVGVGNAAAAMTIGQISELLTMFFMATLFARVRLKWVFLGGIAFGIVRYGLCALNSKGWLLAGVSLHGFAFTLYFITAQIYLEQRVPARLRARAQALLALMITGFGNLIGFLGNGWWKNANTVAGVTDWPVFWLGLGGVMAAVFVFFALSYRGHPRGTAAQRPSSDLSDG